MYVALNGTLVAGRVQWPEFAQLAHKVGFTGTDVLGKAIDAGATATKSLLADLKLQPAVIGLPVDFRKDQQTFDQGFPQVEPMARFAAAIGCPRLSTWLLPSSEQPKDETKRVFRNRLSACAGVLRKHGCRLGLEFVSPVHLRKRFPYEFIWRMDEMLAFARECGRNVGVLLDSWHWHHAEGTVKDILAAGLDGIVHVQAADAPKLPPEKIVDSERLMPGEGIADLVGFFQALQKIGYKGGVSPEVFGRGLKDMPPEEGARLGLETTTAVMKKAGVL
jgi:sugar phosphate isomerase/epimerase